MLTLDELERLAKAATPGVWQPVLRMADQKWYPGRIVGHTAERLDTYEDCSYIAAANPATVLHLIEQIRGLRAALKYILEQPFNGSWDSQAVFIQDVLLSKYPEGAGIG